MYYNPITITTQDYKKVKYELHKKRKSTSNTMSSARTKRKRNKGMPNTSTATIDIANTINDCKFKSASYWDSGKGRKMNNTK